MPIFSSMNLCKFLIVSTCSLWMCVLIPPVSVSGAENGPLRIIVFGAHPDDCEIRVGGTAAKWAQIGHKVKFVSTTNGDVGHAAMAGGPLAQRRTREVEEAAKVLGIETQVLDNHDGELMPTLENRKEIVRLIRQWKADIVITNRPNDYHPDHRYTSILVQDAAYMVTVPYLCPDVPYLEKNPVFLYWPDRFQKPNPFQANIVVGIDDVMDLKFKAIDCIESQFYELGCAGVDPNKWIGKDEAKRAAFLRERFKFNVWDAWRPLLEEFYGKDASPGIRNAEAFELCEYGRQPSKEEWKRLFPFFPDSPK
ncbi:MAG TPA: PIG-L family deacetylase [bacterium]|nr:PIG-L family deacetylase [bacterium]